MARIMTRRKAIPKAIELLQCLPQTEEVVEVIQALKKYASTPLDRWDVASVYEALDEWTESHGGVPPKIKECDSHKELPSHMVFEKLFGKTAKEFLNDYYGEIEYVRIGRHLMPMEAVMHSMEQMLQARLWQKNSIIIV